MTETPAEASAVSVVLAMAREFRAPESAFVRLHLLLEQRSRVHWGLDRLHLDQAEQTVATAILKHLEGRAPPELTAVAMSDESAAPWKLRRPRSGLSVPRRLEAAGLRVPIHGSQPLPRGPCFVSWSDIRSESVFPYGSKRIDEGRPPSGHITGRHRQRNQQQRNSDKG